MKTQANLELLLKGIILESNLWQKIQLLCYLPFTIIYFLNTACERGAFRKKKIVNVVKLTHFYQFVLLARVS